MKDQRRKEAIYRQERQRKIAEVENIDETEQHKDKLQQTVETNDQQQATPSTKTMDIKMVYEMFQDLKTELKANKIPQGVDRIAELERRQDSVLDTLLEMKEEMFEIQAKNYLLSGVVSHLNDVIQDNEGRVDNLEFNNMKKSIVLSRLNTTKKKIECLEEVSNFFDQEMDITPKIDDLFFLSNKGTSPMVLMMATMEDKQLVMQNLGKLKGLVNENVKPFFISHYLPPRRKELRMMEEEIFRRNEELSENQCSEIIRKEGKLNINDITYQKKVNPPTFRYILSLSKEEFNQAMDAPITRGSTVTEQGNSFIGYSAPVDRFDEVQRAYLKMRILHASANHIVMACNVPAIKWHNANEYNDNGDIACGRSLQEWMEQSNIHCRVVFVARYATKTKIGSKRFNCYMDAARKAIEADPINSVNHQDQSKDMLSSAELQKRKEVKRASNPRQNPKSTYKKTNQMGATSLSQRRNQRSRRGKGGTGQSIRGGLQNRHPMHQRPVSGNYNPDTENNLEWPSLRSAVQVANK